MASPENDTVMFALILLGAVAAMLAVALLQRLREIHRLRELGERVQAVADSGDLAARLFGIPRAERNFARVHIA